MFYSIKKKFYNFKQRFKLKERLKLFGIYNLIFVIFWLIGSFLLYLTIDYPDKSIEHIFWVVIISLTSGYDVNDISLNLFGKSIIVIMILLGLAMVAFFTGQLLTIFVELLNRSEFLPERPEGFKFRNPVFIFGNNSKLMNIIRFIKTYNKNLEIIVADKTADEIKIDRKNKIEDVYYAKGDPGDNDFLINILGDDKNNSKRTDSFKTRAIILNNDNLANNQYTYSDERCLGIALAIESINLDFYTILELKSKFNEVHLRRTKVDEWICPDYFTQLIISQSTLNNGLSKTILKMLGDIDFYSKRKTKHIDILPNLNLMENIPENLIGKSFSEVKKILKAKENIIIIGILKYISEAKKYDKNLLKKIDNDNYLLKINPRKRNKDQENGLISDIFSEEIIDKKDKLIYIK